MNEAQQVVAVLLEDDMPIGNYVNLHNIRHRQLNRERFQSRKRVPTAESESGELYGLVEDGQRAYRLRQPLSACPPFENEAHTRAWKAGYFSARDGVSPKVALSTMLNSDQA